MNWQLIKDEWLIGFKPYHKDKILAVQDKFGNYHACKVYSNKKGELVHVSVLDFSNKNENILKNLIRNMYGRVASTDKINLL